MLCPIGYVAESIEWGNGCSASLGASPITQIYQNTCLNTFCYGFGEARGCCLCVCPDKSHLTLRFLSHICALLEVHKKRDYTYAFLQPPKAHKSLSLMLRGWKFHSRVLEYFFIFHIILHIFIYFGVRDNSPFIF